LTTRRIPDPLIPDPLPQALQALRRPRQPVLLEFDLQIRKEISKGRAHCFLRLRGAARCFDANPQHTVPIRRIAFNFLGHSREVDEGILWTCRPWGPGCARSFWRS